MKYFGGSYFGKSYFGKTYFADGITTIEDRLYSDIILNQSKFDNKYYSEGYIK